jgi:hypothetical protein
MVSISASLRTPLTAIGIFLLVWSQAFALPASPMPRTSSPGSPVPPASVREEGLPFGLHQPYLQGITNPKHYANPTTLFINGIAFDTRKGEPTLPPDLSISGYPGGTGYYLVQFNGPITEAMRHDLTSRGAQILDYVPNYAFLVRMSQASKSAVSSLDAVTYVGLFQPAYKLAPDLPTTIGTHEVNILLFRGENAREFMDDLKDDFGAEVFEAGSSNWGHSIRARVDASKLAGIARRPEVRWIEPHAEMRPLNNQCQWVGQDFILNVRRIWYVNGNDNSGGTRLFGESQVTGQSDYGFDVNNYAFRDPAVPITTFGNYPTHRKVIAYLPGSFAAMFGEPGSNYHGSHTFGTICGNEVGSSYVGMAPLAKHWYCDIGNNSTAIYPPQIYFDMWQPAYVGNAGGACRMFAQCWGSGSQLGVYESGAQMWDQFMWDHRDFLGFNAAGGGGSGQGTIFPPATAKDIVTVGATLNGPNALTIASYSSRGPTQDGRLKPTIVCPGDAVMSVCGSSYCAMSGTSMSNANATGHCALVRQYFTEGWYPTGAKNPANGFIPSAALMKAVLVSSGDSMTQMYPNNNCGFGRINLWNTLHFTGITSNNPCWVVDEKDGLRTGEYRDYTVPVLAGSPVKVALVWTDYPGALGVLPNLVNDLDLQVTDPGATVYLGNVMTNGESQTGGRPDSLNVEEVVRRRVPAQGNWVIRVTGRNCPMGPQPYAIVVTGNLNIPPSPQLIVSDVLVYNPKNALIVGRCDTLRITLKNIGTGNANSTSGVLRSLTSYATVVDSGPKTYGDIAANGGTATATFRICCFTSMDCWSQLPFTVRWTSGSLSDNAGLTINANLPDSGGDYMVWGWGDNKDAITWMTILQKRGSRGWWNFNKALNALTWPNPRIIIALMPGLSGALTYDYPVADSFMVGARNDSLLERFLLSTNPPFGGLYVQAPEYGYAQVDPAGPHYGSVYGPRMGVTYQTAMDMEHQITGVRGVAGTYFSAFTFNYNGVDTGFNGPSGCDMDGIQKTGTGQNFMRFVSQRNDTCLVGNISTSPPYRSLVATFLLRGLINSGGNTKEAYVDSVMHWLDYDTYGVAQGPGSTTLLHTEFHLGQPNPSTGTMTFNYQLAKDRKSSLKVYNLAGQLVRALVDGPISAGVHEALWDGRNNEGKRLPAGVYLVRFEAGDYQAVKKAVIVR